MNSITYKESFIPCPNCSHPIGSLNPSCERCGLPVSGTGIEELAADEEFVQSALRGAFHLQAVFGGSIIMLLVSYLYYRLVPESLIFTLIVLFVGAIYYIFLILKWQYDFRKLPVWNTTAQTAIRAKNIAALAFLVEVTLIVLYLFINW